MMRIIMMVMVMTAMQDNDGNGVLNHKNMNLIVTVCLVCVSSQMLQ